MDPYLGQISGIVRRGGISWNFTGLRGMGIAI
jgi:hypothetical protein